LKPSAIHGVARPIREWQTIEACLRKGGRLRPAERNLGHLIRHYGEVLAWGELSPEAVQVLYLTSEERDLCDQIQANDG
jgi:hypothetical protein